jgi:serine/threonine-protein kinase HipA
MTSKAKQAHTLKLSVLMAGEAVGTLAQDERGQVWFEYDAAWVQQGFALSPMPSFALKLGAFKATRQTFEGLHGVFNDALPDGWGLLLMDRALKQARNWAPHDITPLDRLAYMGNRAMGALHFKPLLAADQRVEVPVLDSLAEQAMLAGMGVSMGGGASASAAAASSVARSSFVSLKGGAAAAAAAAPSAKGSAAAAGKAQKKPGRGLTGLDGARLCQGEWKPHVEISRVFCS